MAPRTDYNQWWVISRTSGIPKDPGQTVYVAVEANSSAAATAYGTSGYGGTVVSGPYATKGDANNWIDQQTGLASGTTPSTTNQVSNATGPVSVPNPLTGIEGIADFFQRLTEPNTWIRVGEFAAGGVLFYVGLKTAFPAQVAAATAPIKSVAKTAVKAAGTAAVM